MGKNNKSDNKMYYRMLGATGLQVSVLSFGFWATYGVKDGLTDDEGVNMAKACMSLFCFSWNWKIRLHELVTF